MKKIYTAPEAELLCFRPVEELAAVVTMDNLLAEPPVTGKVNGTTLSGGDVLLTI